MVHVSLDGFVAGKNGELDGFPIGDENLAFVNTLTRDADAAVFGRISYELLNAHWPTAGDNPAATEAEKEYSNWYNKAEKIVVSRTLQDNLSHTKIISENLAGEISKLKEKPGKNMLMFGSPSLAAEWIQEGLVGYL